MSIEIKICGLKTPEAITAAIDGGASHVGFIFFPRSPRHVEPQEAGRLRTTAKGRARAVAVSVDADDAMLDAIVAGMAPDMLQLHGTESPDRVSAVKSRYGLPVMKSFSITQADDLGAIAQYRGIADKFLFDARPPEGSLLPGGNGVPFDWTLLTGLDPDIDYMLSGGLNAANIGDALALATPPGIDISSGVEREPGIKDAALIAKFFKAVARAQTSSAA